MKERLLLILKGVAMGSADVIPGVSGGTIALITGIYDDLLGSLNSVDKQAFQLFFKGRFKDFWLHINGAFLVSVFSGVLIAIFSLAKLLTYLLDTHPIAVWSFFFGLILISVWYVKPKKVTASLALVFILGALFAYLVTELSPSETPEGLWFIFLAGALAICAMILPGISGSFILLLLSKYTFILGAVKSFDLKIIFVFGLGCIVGLISFSRLIYFLLEKHKDLTLSVLAGFLLGSLNKIWPWRIEDNFSMQKLSPSQYESMTGEPSQLYLALGLFVLGGFLVISLERFGRRAQAES